MQFGADDERQAAVFRRSVRPHDAGERVAIGDGQRRVSEFSRARHQFVRVRRPFQEGEVGFAMQFGVAQCGEPWRCWGESA